MPFFAGLLHVNDSLVLRAFEFQGNVFLLKDELSVYKDVDGIQYFISHFAITFSTRDKVFLISKPVYIQMFF